jgi:ribonuclease P protein subunit RPR2
MQPGKIAEERMEILFEKAEEKFDEDSELADRYVEIAQRIGERTETPVPKKFRRMFCSHCGCFLRPGVNCQARIDSKDGAVEYSCEECGKEDRYEY